MTLTRQQAEKRLPAACHGAPLCVICMVRTEWDGDGWMCPGGCGLAYGEVALDAHYAHPDAEPCGAPCDRPEHWRDGSDGWVATCETCVLPAGHERRGHWHRVDLRRVEDA